MLKPKDKPRNPRAGIQPPENLFGDPVFLSKFDKTQGTLAALFHYDRGLKLTRPTWRSTFAGRHRERLSRTPIRSHGPARVCALHAGHCAALPVPLRTAADARLPYREPLEWGGLRLTTYPAGHCLGSAMLLAEDGDRSLLYRATSSWANRRRPNGPKCPGQTSGHREHVRNPVYRMTPRAQAIDQLLTLVRQNARQRSHARRRGLRAGQRTRGEPRF